jgi:hypothetical protein
MALPRVQYSPFCDREYTYSLKYIFFKSPRREDRRDRNTKKKKKT